MEGLKSEVSSLKKSIDSKDEERRKMSREYRSGVAMRTFSVYYEEDMITDERVYRDINSDEILKREPLPKKQNSDTLFQDGIDSKD